MEQYGLPEYDAEILTGDRHLSEYFEQAVQAYGGDPKKVSNYLRNDVLRLMGESSLSADKLRLTPAYLASILKLVDSGTINTSTGKSLLWKVQESGRAPQVIVEQEGLAKVSDDAAIREVAQKVVQNNPRSRDLPRRQGDADRLVCRPGDARDARQGRSHPGAQDPGRRTKKVTAC